MRNFTDVFVCGGGGGGGEANSPPTKQTSANLCKFAGLYLL